jgi:hypothetical protein
MSVWSLLVPLWVYATLIGALATGAGGLLAPNDALRWTATVVLVVIGGGSFPAVFGWLQHVTRDRR